MNILKLIHEIIADKYYFIFIIIFLLCVMMGIYKIYYKFIKVAPVKLHLITNFDPVKKIKKLDNECYMILYNTYNLISSNINVQKSEIFDEKYFLKLNDAKRIFYGVKRNNNLIKSNYLLLKIFKKMNLYNIEKKEIDNTIIYLILLALNKKK